MFILLVNKDLEWLVLVEGSVSLAEARIAIIKEFIFVLIVVLPHLLNIIHSHAKNLGHALNNENIVLKQVAAGNYNQLVPISRYDEFKIMRTHAKIGSEAISVAERELGENSFLRFASEIAISHHEKWDGSGYPRRLNGNNIPVSGRLMAVADVYDALISKRVYKPAFSHDKAMNIMREGNAKHFDPDMIDALNACEHEFIEISKQFHDEHTEMVRIVSPLFSN